MEKIYVRLTPVTIGKRVGGHNSISEYAHTNIPWPIENETKNL